ncbi:MAG: cupin domain-containing protein [Ignavibacteriaceae bacterium]
MENGKNELGDVLPKNLAEEIEYQSSSIVSKQLLKKPNGNITLFAFDKDESLTEHTSPFEAVILVVDGSMEISVGGKPFIVTYGQFIILPPNVPHGVKAIEKSKMTLTMIK